MKTPLTVFALVFGLLAVPAASHAAANVYKCQGPSGSAVYSQFPCPKPAAVTAEATPPTLASLSGAAEDVPPLDAATCSVKMREINDRFSLAADTATNEIRRLREQMVVSGGYSLDTPNNALRAELSAAEDRLDLAGRTQRQDMVELRKRCSSSRAQ